MFDCSMVVRCGEVCVDCWLLFINFSIPKNCGIFKWSALCTVGSNVIVKIEQWTGQKILYTMANTEPKSNYDYFSFFFKLKLFFYFQFRCRCSTRLAVTRSIIMFFFFFSVSIKNVYCIHLHHCGGVARYESL